MSRKIFKKRLWDIVQKQQQIDRMQKELEKEIENIRREFIQRLGSGRRRPEKEAFKRLG